MAKSLLLWSGGLDSTACLLHTIKNHPDWELETLYVNLGNNKDKATKEVESRNKIKTVIQDYYKRTFSDYTITVESVLLPWKIDPPKASMQPYLWIMGLLMHLANQGYSYDKLIFGYIREDDFWHFKTNFQEIVLNGQEMAFNHRNTQFEYPLEWYTKYEVYNDFMKEDRIIRDMTWTCENPINSNGKIEICGYCKPCKVFRDITSNKLIDTLPTIKNEIPTDCCVAAG